MSGELVPEKNDLESVLRLFLFNIDKGTLFSDRILRGLGRFIHQFKPLFLLNNLQKSKTNVAHHYDLNSDLYRLFLDKDMQYSCAYFKTGTETLEAAQIAKKKHIAQKLALTNPKLHVLDIGCGWGGLAITLARDYGVRVTGITLSKEQLLIAKARVKKAGLSDRIDLKLCDYRSLHQKFDRIVSVGMLEHVGKSQYQEFFLGIKKLLMPDGIALIHSIGRKDGPASTNPWIARYIFPGGYSPALSEIFQAVEESKLWVTDCEILRLHYAQTIWHWRQRFERQQAKIKEMFDERFVRMFRFYLTSAELAFRVQDHMNFQLQLSPQLETLPLTRDYINA
ncbi:cyclopropane-fatty-acyl-phospholipid synthase [Lasius niger]|uniref:Cyclopropane-fatty-acyl-phospholipid synthase n=1 Tax=Lasius niger TaxID=67767 RepID=A0A0J7KZL9_LASNI|nr:cyclopropane-fatty-acyl-phospholipid synthase [Lasius niger]